MYTNPSFTKIYRSNFSISPGNVPGVVHGNINANQIFSMPKMPIGQQIKQKYGLHMNESPFDFNKMVKSLHKNIDLVSPGINMFKK